MGIVRVQDGTVFVATTISANRILTVSPDGTVTTLAGSDEEGFVDGRGEARIVAKHVDDTTGLTLLDSQNDLMTQKLSQ